MKRDKIEVIVGFLIILVAFSAIPILWRRISISMLAGVIILFAIYSIHKRIMAAKATTSFEAFSESRPTKSVTETFVSGEQKQ